MKNTVNVNSITAMSTDNLAMLLTAYERFGSLSEADLVEMLCDEFEVTEDIISDYNEYLLTNSYYSDVVRSLVDLEDEIKGMDPAETFRLGYSSKEQFSWNDDYYCYDGYNNLVSYNTTRLLAKIADNDDFKKWYIRENILDDLDVDEILTVANDLVKEGY